MAICLERRADLHTAQLMPLPLTVSCFSKIQIGFTFLVPADPGSPGQRAVKRVCVCVTLAISNITYFVFINTVPVLKLKLIKWNKYFEVVSHYCGYLPDLLWTVLKITFNVFCQLKIASCFCYYTCHMLLLWLHMLYQCLHCLCSLEMSSDNFASATATNINSTVSSNNVFSGY